MKRIKDMYEIDVSYEGSQKYKVKSLDCEVEIGFPVEGRKASGITPPALLLASLGSCLAVYMERYLVSAGIKFGKFFINVKSDISKESPRYLNVIDIKIGLTGAILDEKREAALLEFIKNCPVHNTLINRPRLNIAFEARGNS